MQQVQYIETTSTPVVTEGIPDLPTDDAPRQVTTTEQLQATEPPTRDLVGAEVFYVLTGGRSQGQRRPAVIVKDWGNDLVNLQVFTDATNDYVTNPGSNGLLWATSVSYAPVGNKALGTWHWRSENL